MKVKIGAHKGLVLTLSLQTKVQKECFRPYYCSAILLRYNNGMERKQRRIILVYYIQHDQVIILRNLGPLLGPSTALYRPVVKHCILTNKAERDHTSSEETGP